MPRAQHTLTLLAVTDLPRSIAFYGAAFGWEQVVDVPVYGEFALPDGMHLGLYEREAFARNTGQLPARLAPGEIAPTELYFRVDDLPRAIDRLMRAGARLLSDRAPRAWGDEAAYFADPDGNVLVLARPLTAEGPEETADLRDFAHRWMTLWQGGDLGLVTELHSADFIDQSPAGRAADRDGFREGVVALRRAFPDFHAVTEEILVDEAQRKATIRWRASGTHRGPFMGIAPTGKSVQFRGIEIVRVECGKIVERWGEWDGLDLIDQLEPLEETRIYPEPSPSQRPPRRK